MTKLFPFICLFCKNDFLNDVLRLRIKIKRILLSNLSGQYTQIFISILEATDWQMQKLYSFSFWHQNVCKHYQLSKKSKCRKLLKSIHNCNIVWHFLLEYFFSTFSADNLASISWHQLKSTENLLKQKLSMQNTVLIMNGL